MHNVTDQNNKELGKLVVRIFFRLAKSFVYEKLSRSAMTCVPCLGIKGEGYVHVINDSLLLCVVFFFFYNNNCHHHVVGLG